MADNQPCAASECTNTFEPQRSTARYCSATCRQRAARARRASEKAAQVDAAAAGKDGDAEQQLVTVTRRELDQAGALDTVDGQLALNLARKLVDVDAKGVSALTKELRAIIAAAKAQPAAPAAAESAPATEEDDEVAEARRRREQKARQAADRT